MLIYHHHRQQQQVDQVEEEAAELQTFRVVEEEVVHLFQEVEAVVEERMIELEDREAVVEVVVERLGQMRWGVRALQAEVVQVYDDW